MINLRMSLKTKWFEMTKAEIKTEDYREITPYWAKRFFEYTHKDIKLTESEWLEICNDLNGTLGEIDELEYVIDNWYLEFKIFDINTMTLGYPKSCDTERILKLEHKGIEIRTGNPDWGAEPGKLYFVIKHGNIINK